ncbi:Protein LYK5 [Apostasia shenzhenica]|uniref:Protein LYK5 n=1 Tax=Apostasia shenzhenica TaxID=1088818 RepID=A0A2I0ALY9_9ASPA|nr:Protein LYK5 [Apostasia shenzhenica]
MAASFPNVLVFVVVFFFSSRAQQPYINNAQLNCYATNASSALGYSCNGLRPSCQSFLTFRAESPYLSPPLIAFLLSADTANISRINSVPDVATLPAGELLIVPVPCFCSGQFYQHNASYTLKSAGENYFTVANDTYQGLSACQALIDQNHFDSRHLKSGDQIVVPLRCACPTLNQTSAGVRYLLSYLVTWGDDIPTIANRFNADYPSVLAANNLTAKSTIFPFTTLLIPLTTEPTRISSAPSPPPDVSQPSGAGGSSNKWVFAGVGIGAGVLILLGFPSLFFCLWRRRRRRQIQRKKGKLVSSSEDYGGLPFKSSSTPSMTTPSPLASSVIRELLDSMTLTLYKFDELKRATGNFDEDHRIRGSVFRGIFNGDAAAVKRLKGDVSNEINILKQISHSNVIKLSGFCLHEGNTYMVYEFADLGSLSDWLHHKKNIFGDSSTSLTWKQRIQIACDVADGLNYLHNYTNPPYIHKNLKSNNILLSRDFRAKVANFGLARPVEEEEGGSRQLTRHVVGTQGYMSPEYLEHGLITPKLDVFAFGVLLLELLSGKEASFAKEEERREVLLWAAIDDILSGEDVINKLRRFIDHRLGDDYPFELAFAMAELAKRCVARDPAARPNMMEVLVSLSAICNSTLDWEPGDLSNSSPGSTICARLFSPLGS